MPTPTGGEAMGTLGDTTGGMTYVPRGDGQQNMNAGSLREVVRVAILVPQSGPNAAVGHALSQAAQLALFDLNEPNFQLIPKDTGGTAEGAREAATQAAREGARLILGPLFASEVQAVKPVAQTYGLSVIGFSTDWRVAGDNVMTMGVLPFGQASRVADFAARQGLKRIAIIATKDLYGDAVTNAFTQTAGRYGMNIVSTVRIAPNGSDATSAIQQLTGGQVLAAGAAPYDAIFMPVGGQALKILASTLKAYGLGNDRLRYLGTGLWDEGDVARDPNLAGGIYAAPAPQQRSGFERNYARVYGSNPPRLASIGYDAAALAVVLARQESMRGGRVTYARADFANPNGFSRVDGIFRFRPDGLIERGMAVLQIAPGGSLRVLEPAPNSFVQAAR